MDHLNTEVEERDIDRTELYLAEEVFFVGTSVEILPAVSIDRMDVNFREIGKITNSLNSLYMKAARGANPQYHHWLTRI